MTTQTVAEHKPMRSPFAKRPLTDQVLRPLRVQVVDDDPDMVDSMAMVLGLWGHHVRRDYSGSSALTSATKYRPDVVLLDLGMPGMDGFELARRFRRQQEMQRTNLVAVTGHAEESVRVRAMRAGFDGFYPKPVELAMLDKFLVSMRGALAETRQIGVLVVDDDESVGRFVAAGLKQCGFAVWTASGGQEAVDQYRIHQPSIDVVLMDVRMPGLDGPATLGALRREAPNVRCCFMSGDLGEYSEDGLRELGASGVLRKPFRPNDVAQLIRDSMAKRNVPRE